MISAARNIDHGDRSWETGSGFSRLAPAGDGLASVEGDDALEDGGADVWSGVAGADNAGVCADGAVGCGAPFCCAIAGEISDNIVSVAASESVLSDVLNITAFTSRLNRKQDH
jgi:hypothetical protein